MINCLSGIKEVKNIKKQTNKKIIIPLLFILVLILGIGAVSASDVNTGDNLLNSASSDEVVLIEISGQVEQCSNGEPFQGVSVTVHDNGTQVASTTTSADGTYITNFQSLNRVFTVTASANGHKPSTQTVTVNKNQETYTGTANFQLGNNDAYVYHGWTTNPDEDYTFSDGTTIDLAGAANAFTTINEGINYATTNPGINTVYIAPGTYNEYSMSIDTSVNLHGENHDTTIIDADDNARILTIWNGATVNIEQITFRDGASEYGGALRVESGTTTITDCTFDSNTVPDYGGAIYINPGATVTITGTTFTDNPSGYSGGAINNEGTLYVAESTFTGNSADNYGGAIFNRGTLTVTDTTFTSNTGPYAGAIRNQDGSAIITNCVFTSNTASSNGGAINSMGSSAIVTILGCTFTGNTAQIGGAIVNWASNTLTVNYNRFYNNIANQGSAIYCVSCSVNAENNWWGCNNPISDFSSLIYGASAPTQWLYMTISADPTTINNGETSLITVSFNNFSLDGTTYTEFEPSLGHIPDGTPVTFATTLGTIPATVVNTVSGIATATFTASQTAGTAYISGLIDDYQILYNPENPNTTPYTTVTINPVANVNIIKTINDPKAKYNVGDLVTYNITVTNPGPDTATGATITDYVSGIGDDLVEYFQFVSATGPYTFDDASKTVTWSLSDLVAGDSVTYTLTVKILANATGETVRNKADLWLNEYPGHVYDVIELYTAKSDLYVKITSNKNNPEVGEKFTLTYKLGNKGPDAAENVITTIPLPEGFHLSNISGDGTWTYDEATRTITWTMSNVPVGDPYLYITGWFTRAGSYVFTASVNSNTYNINTQGVSAITVNAQNVVRAKTISMQETGTPITPILLSMLLVIGGLVLLTRKK